MILMQLKAATADTHARVEARLPLLAADLTRARYAATLAVLYAFYRPLEARLARHADWDAWGLDFAARRKTPLLERDLRDLGHSARSPAALPDCDALPAVDALPRAFGCMYVLEGATLGGQVIARHLARVLPAGGGDGRAYVTSYGDQVGPMWQRFRAAVTAYAAAHGDEVGASIVAGASDTFAALDGWLEARRAELEGARPAMRAHGELPPHDGVPVDGGAPAAPRPAAAPQARPRSERAIRG